MERNYTQDHARRAMVANHIQRVREPSKRDALLLNPKLTLQTFDKWVVYFIGPINPPT